MPFRVCYYHVVWSTKHRAPLISPQIEPITIDAVQRKSADLNSEIYAINTVADHVHVAVSISPAVAVSEWLKQVKGLSAYSVNNAFPGLPDRFQWQGGYGILTFGKKQLAKVVEYIEQQKEHHTTNTLEAYLEYKED